MEGIRIGLIGGTGLGVALAAQTQAHRQHDIETPFGKPSAPIIESTYAGLPIFILSRHGDGHLLNPSQVPYRANIFALKQLGCTHIIASGAVPVVRLTEVFRQAARSQIIISAHRINQGVMPEVRKPEGDSDFYFVPADDPETAGRRIVDLVKTRIPQRFGLDAMRDIQVLCPMNRGGVGARSLNLALQAALNPAGERKIERFGWTFAPGDKVMQIENDYDKEVYNGDIGYVDDVDVEAGELIARFDARAVTYVFGELDTLSRLTR